MDGGWLDAGVTLRKLVGGVVTTDNASAALASQKELMLLVENLVKEEMGDDEWNKLTPQQQRKLVKVWCVRARRVRRENHACARTQFTRALAPLSRPCRAGARRACATS